LESIVSISWLRRLRGHRRDDRAQPPAQPVDAVFDLGLDHIEAEAAAASGSVACASARCASFFRHRIR
jgi:hypothetical protein